MAVNGLEAMTKLMRSKLVMRSRLAGESKNDGRRLKGAKPEGRTMAQQALAYRQTVGRERKHTKSKKRRKWAAAACL
jgi:hypothetical protein